MTRLGKFDVPVVWHTPSLPYRVHQDRMTDHVADCAQCAQAQFTVAEDLPREPLCPEGSALLLALADAIRDQHEGARSN